MPASQNTIIQQVLRRARMMINPYSQGPTTPGRIRQIIHKSQLCRLPQDNPANSVHQILNISSNKIYQMNVRTPLLQRIQIKNLTKKALNTKKEMEYQKNIRKERLRYLYERRRSYEKAEATISEYKSKYQDDNKQEQPTSIDIDISMEGRPGLRVVKGILQ